MSRIPVREAIIVSSTVSAVVSLCIVGSIAASASEAPESGHLIPTQNGLAEDSATAPYSPLLSPSQAGDRSLTAGSYQGVWFGLPQPAGAGGDSTSTAAAAALSGFAAPSATPAPADASASSVHVQSRTSVSAAISGGDPRNIAQALAATYTWTGDQWTCLDKLWNHESKYETTVRNPSSGAYGIPQALPASKMGSVGADWRTNPVTQIVWGLGYIQDRYGSPCGAWSYWLRHNSY